MINTGQLIFHRIFHRNDFTVRLVDHIKAGVKRGALAGTGRARDQEDTVGKTQYPFHGGLIIGKKSEFRQSEDKTGLVENTHTNRLTVIGRNGGDAQIDGGASIRRAQLNAPILRQAPFRDAHVRHDLETADDGGLKFLGRIGHHLQDTVDAIAQAQTFFQRLDMNIARTQTVRFENHEIDQTNDVRVVAGLMIIVRFSLTVLYLELITAVGADERIDHFARVSVVTLESQIDLIGRSNNWIDVVAQFLAERINRIKIKRIGQRDSQMPSFQKQRHDGETISELAWRLL